MFTRLVFALTEAFPLVPAVAAVAVELPILLREVLVLPLAVTEPEAPPLLLVLLTFSKTALFLADTRADTFFTWLDAVVIPLLAAILTRLVFALTDVLPLVPAVAAAAVELPILLREVLVLPLALVDDEPFALASFLLAVTFRASVEAAVVLALAAWLCPACTAVCAVLLTWPLTLAAWLCAACTAAWVWPATLVAIFVVAWVITFWVVAAFTVGKTACVTTLVAVCAPILSCAMLAFAAKNITAKDISLITFFMMFLIEFLID
jgi:hypothetical protein